MRAGGSGQGQAARIRAISIATAMARALPVAAEKLAAIAALRWPRNSRHDHHFAVSRASISVASHTASARRVCGGHAILRARARCGDGFNLLGPHRLPCIDIKVHSAYSSGQRVDGCGCVR